MRYEFRHSPSESRQRVGALGFQGVKGRIATCAVFVLLLLTSLTLSGCTDKNEAYIQGDWFFSAAGVVGVTDQTNVHTYWHFGDGRVGAHSCSDDYPDINAHYRVVESDRDALLLELFDIEEGAVEEGYQMQIVIDRAADSLSIQGVGPFEEIP